MSLTLPCTRSHIYLRQAVCPIDSAAVKGFTAQQVMHVRPGEWYRRPSMCFVVDLHVTTAVLIHLLVWCDMPYLLRDASAIASHHTSKMVFRSAVFGTPKCGKVIHNLILNAHLQHTWLSWEALFVSVGVSPDSSVQQWVRVHKARVRVHQARIRVHWTRVRVHWTRVRVRVRVHWTRVWVRVRESNKSQSECGLELMSPTVEVLYFNPTFNNFFQMAFYIDYNFGPKLNRLVYRNVSLFLGKLE